MHDIETTFKESITIHGVFMNIFNVGTLIVGPSGIGKSDLALSLLCRGHQLVADDAPEFQSNSNGVVTGKSPIATQDFLAVTALGIINVRQLFGKGSMIPKQSLDLILALNDEKKITPEQRLFGIHEKEIVLGQLTPKIIISIEHTKNLTETVECAVKLSQLENKNYNASEELMKKTSPQVAK